MADNKQVSGVCEHNWNNQKCQKCGQIDPDKGLHYTERRERIKRIIEAQGLLHINKTQLAEKFGVGRDAIYNDLDRILEELDEEDIQQQVRETKVALMHSLKQSLKTAHKLLLADDQNVRLRAARTVGQLAGDLTGTLESYGVKEKIADRVEVGGTYDDLKSRISDILGSDEDDDTT